MSEISRVALFGKLNRLGFQSIESATVFCKMRGNPYVELVHWIHQILQLQDSDLHRLISHYELEPARVAADVVRSLDSLPRGATAISDLSPHLEQAVERAWVYASLQFGATEVRTGHLVYGMLKTSGLRNLLEAISPEFRKIETDTLAKHFEEAVAGSPEERMSASDGSGGHPAQPGEASSSMAPQLGGGDALKQFCSDLTEKAREGEIDPIVGRDEEIRQIIDVLMRRRQNNPILTGEAGVGKTAVGGRLCPAHRARRCTRNPA